MDLNDLIIKVICYNPISIYFRALRMFKIYLDFLFILPISENLQKFLNILKLIILCLNHQGPTLNTVQIYF